MTVARARRRGATKGILAGAAAAAAVLAAAADFGATRHGNPETGAFRIESAPRGSCAQCHDQHASREGTPTGGPFESQLFAPNDNALCATCHTGAGGFEVYPGFAPWERSAHAISPSMVWPGPEPRARRSGDAGLCLNCHDPHGREDGAGAIPALAAAREEALCLACHDGSPADDVRSAFQEPFAHPIAVSRRHEMEEGGVPARYGSGERHAECVDCHNPHREAADPLPPTAPTAPARITGVGRVRVTNGVAGTRPIYQWAGPEETAFAQEYELCFKCHSSWTTQPAGQPDLALQLNPNNPSFHPVEAPGRNRIDERAFTTGWSAERMTYCGDCHGSDDPLARGPHGSSYRHLLKKEYATVSVPTPVAPTDLCFECHAWDTYANLSADPSAHAASRFNPPGTAQGHVFHVAQQGYSCYSCHATHGSTLYPALIAVGRAPGLAGYTQTTSGGTCTSSCHPVRIYAASYPR
jgi:predicted CXXCH cytochrome family protein